jgi:glycosyltransferase involved in cell wall biosynthesis
MRLLLLSDINSAHTQKWASGLLNRDFEVGIFSFSAPRKGLSLDNKIKVLNPVGLTSSSGLLNKIAYLKFRGRLIKSITDFKPDIVHAHYASSYGLLGALTGFHPFVVSVWGTDVYNFPLKSPLHNQLMKYTLSKADALCSTSFCMKDELMKYTSKPIEVIPFGVDQKIFKPKDQRRQSFEFVIGFVKALEPGYGHEILLRAFAGLKPTYFNKQIRLCLVGDGSYRPVVERLAAELGIQNRLVLLGNIPNIQVPEVLSSFDLFASLTTVNESFGVSLVEAMACTVPIVATDTPGFLEVLGDESCGKIVPRNNVEAAIKAIEDLILDDQKRLEVSANAYKRFIKNYCWNECLNSMISVYSSVIKTA